MATVNAEADLRIAWYHVIPNSSLPRKTSEYRKNVDRVLSCRAISASAEFSCTAYERATNYEFVWVKHKFHGSSFVVTCSRRICGLVVTVSTISSQTFLSSGATVLNDQPTHVTSPPSLAIFRQRLKTFLFSRSYSDIVIRFLTVDPPVSYTSVDLAIRSGFSTAN